jgi:Coenzyme PQQ synthesis protein D (PqqD)
MVAAEDPRLRARVTVPDHVVVRRFADDTVALNLATGQYHGLNDVATVMLEALRAGEAAEDVARGVAERCGVPADVVRGDLLGLLDDLASRDLIEIHEPS